MTSTRAAASLALVAAALTTITLVPGWATLAAQTPAAPAPVAPPPATATSPGAERGQAPPAAPGQGRGGGRGNASAALYTERCSGCHGVDASGGRAPSLFDDVWTHGADDESIARTIANGLPSTEMMAFKDQLAEPQIWQLVAYLKTQAANLKAKPPYVPDPDGQVIKSEKQSFKIEVLARNLETPWGLAFLPDGRLLVTERPGRLRIWQKGQLLPAVTGTPTVWERQDGGLFDVEVHPQYAQNGWIYLAYSEPGPNNTAPPSMAAAAAAGLLPQRGGGAGATPAAPPAGAVPPGGAAPAAGTVPADGAPAGGAAPTGTRPDPAPAAAAAAAPRAAAANTSNTVIVRGKINAKNEWVEQQVLFRARPETYTANNSHFGARFIFDRQGHLFFSIGERGEKANAQDLTNPLGKIHRVNDDGTIPKDNPFVNQAGAVPSIWSYGHRNPQGLAWDPVTGKLWESEHGPQGGDEINIVEKGHNYGWGVITMGVEPGITKRSEPGMEQPIVYYTPTIAPSGITFYAANRYPGWKNSLLVGALGGQQLRRLEVAGDKVTHQEVLFNTFGRVHDVIVGPDGYLYVTLQLPGRGVSDSTPGMVARLTPQ